MLGLQGSQWEGTLAGRGPLAKKCETCESLCLYLSASLQNHPRKSTQRSPKKSLGRQAASGAKITAEAHWVTALWRTAPQILPDRRAKL